MAETVTVFVWAGFSLLGDERRVDRHPYNVSARRNHGLTVAAVEHEILPAEKEAIGVCPSGTDTLIAGNADRTATPILWALRRYAPNRHRIGIGIEHTETALRRPPYFACPGINQLIKRIVTEVIMVMAFSEFKQSIVGSHMFVGIADVNVHVAGIGGHHSKAHESMHARSNAAFDDATGFGGKIFIADNPL